MKNQYFGDINDYRKYGLLRLLVEATGLSLGVCWLLTEDDGRTDGEFRDYLTDPQRWRPYDPPLYDSLQRLLTPGTTRSVRLAAEWVLLPGASYYTDVLTDPRSARQTYFEGAWTRLADCPLLFLDPDNGIEVKSTPRGAKGASKYVYWVEIEEAYDRGHSLIVYQHFPRQARESYTARLCNEVHKRLRAPLVDSFATPHVLFLLVARPEHAPAFLHAHDLIADGWRGQIRPLSHVAI